MNASDGFKISLQRLGDELDGTGACIVNHVHDEIVVEVADDRKKEIRAVVEETMESVFEAMFQGVEFEVVMDEGRLGDED